MILQLNRQKRRRARYADQNYAYAAGVLQRLPKPLVHESAAAQTD